LMLSGFGNVQSQSLMQEDSFWNNVRFGGSLGLNFSDGYFNTSLSPTAVYDLNRYASAGVGLLGSYTDAENYSSMNFGGSVVGLLSPVRFLNITDEVEEFHVSRKWELEGGALKDSYWYPALFLGAGYTTGPMTIGIRYDVLYDSKTSIYA